MAEKSSIKTQRFNSRENSAKILETKVLDDETLQYTCCTVRCNKSVEKEIPEKEKAEFIFWSSTCSKAGVIKYISHFSLVC